MLRGVCLAYFFELDRSQCSTNSLCVLALGTASTALALYLGITGTTALFTRPAPPPTSSVATVRPSLSFDPAGALSNLDLVPPPVPEWKPELDATPEALPDVPSSASANLGRQLLGAAMGAIAVAAAFAFKRLQLSKETIPAGSALPASTASTLDPPVTQSSSALEAPVYNKGIVTPEEAMDLPFTITQLKDAIPERCFEKSLGWSLFYMLRDFAIVGLLYHFQPAFFNLGILGKFLWWNITGFYGWCLFVVGHDCGHGSFCNYGWLNQVLGHICHAPLCVPFNAWAISHRHHHQFHNDVDRDHSWRPSVASSVSQLTGLVKAVRFSPFILISYPIYLLSPSQENGFSGCHFWPWNPLFKKEERLGVAVSALAVIAWLGVLAAATAKLGVLAMFQLYWIPYVIFTAWLGIVTLLQHTDKNALFFRGKAWNYLRGAMSTIDRTYLHLIDPFDLGYGRIIDHLHHHISDGHVVHHIFFTKIPHYRLKEATAAIRPILGKHYRYDETPIAKALLNCLRECWFVDDIPDGVVSYKGEGEYKQWESQQQLQGSG